MFYFNLDNGKIDLDQLGIDLPDMAAARAEAVSTLADRLRDSNVTTLLGGKPGGYGSPANPAAKELLYLIFKSQRPTDWPDAGRHLFGPKHRLPRCGAMAESAGLSLQAAWRGPRLSID